MAKPTDSPQGQEPEQTDRRESYIAGDPDSAPELVRFINCKTETDITTIPIQELITAAT